MTTSMKTNLSGFRQQLNYENYAGIYCGTEGSTTMLNRRPTFNLKIQTLFKNYGRNIRNIST
jgi:hypothetical protein